MRKILSIFIIFYAFLATPVFAQVQTTEIEIDTALEDLGVNLDLGNIASNIIAVLITLGSVALLFYLVMAGYKWLSAGGDKAKVEESRQMITNAIIGMAILASVFAIYNIVDSFFGIGIVDDPNLEGNADHDTGGNGSKDDCSFYVNGVCADDIKGGGGKPIGAPK